MLPETTKVSVTDLVEAMNLPLTVTLDKLTLLWRYPPAMIDDIVLAAEAPSAAMPAGTSCPTNGCIAARFIMFLPTTTASPRQHPPSPHLQGQVRPPWLVLVEFNPAKASEVAPPYVFDELAAFLPETRDELFEKAYVTRFDLAVDVPGIRCRDLAAQRTSHHKNAEVIRRRRRSRQFDPHRRPRVADQDRDLPAHLR